MKQTMEQTYGVVMAGGKGERFWPLSTDDTPKPFIKLLGQKTMIQMTVERLLRIVPENRIVVVLGAGHLPVAKEQLALWPDIRFLVEPGGRDTAPCIGFTAVTLAKEDPGAVMVVVPADHYIPDDMLFARTMSTAINLAKEGNVLVTTGIKPTRPETGYGYIQAGERLAGAGEGCFAVSRFVEKPDAEGAAQYLAEGGYYWNSGIFVWRAQTVLQEMEEHMPALSRGLEAIRRAIDVEDGERVAHLFLSLEKISIDYGLMEKTRNVVMIEAGFAWDDVGTWNSVRRVLPVDAKGNCVHGKAVCIDTTDCVVYADDTVVGTIGLSNMIVAASRRGVLVCPRDRDQEARKIVAGLGKDE